MSNTRGPRLALARSNSATCVRTEPNKLSLQQNQPIVEFSTRPITLKLKPVTLSNILGAEGFVNITVTFGKTDQAVKLCE